MSDKRNLFNKVWDLHTVRTLPGGQTQLFIGLHLIHEVTSPQAFEILRERGLKVAFPQRTIATVDHIVPTDNQARPFRDELAEQMMSAIEKNCADFGVTLLNLSDNRQGIVHVVGPEQGLTQPGMTIVCGDSHTSTHGAFGAIAIGIGTSNVAEVLATQTMFLNRPKVRRVVVNGQLGPGVYAKDVILYIIQKLGVQGGVGYAYEFAGSTFDAMSMEERMTVCNMSIEAGARAGLRRDSALPAARPASHRGRARAALGARRALAARPSAHRSCGRGRHRRPSAARVLEGARPRDPAPHRLPRGGSAVRPRASPARRRSRN